MLPSPPLPSSFNKCFIGNGLNVNKSFNSSAYSNELGAIPQNLSNDVRNTSRQSPLSLPDDEPPTLDNEASDDDVKCDDAEAA